MDDIDKLMSEYPQFSYEYESMPRGIDGFTVGKKVIINSDISKEEQLQWLYEEIGHEITSEENITDYKDKGNMWQECRARDWGMTHRIPYKELLKIENDEYENDYDAAVDLGVQVDYLHTVGLMYGFRYKSVDW